MKKKWSITVFLPIQKFQNNEYYPRVKVHRPSPTVSILFFMLIIDMGGGYSNGFVSKRLSNDMVSRMCRLLPGKRGDSLL